jgi:PAS domain S-box-containing protein
VDVPVKPFQLAPGRPAAGRREAPLPAEPRDSIHILIVDDQPANLLALESLLAEGGYSITRAESGPEALRCMLQRSFALVLLDVLMPGMDGFETAELIRSRPQSRDTPIIFITAASETHAGHGYSLGAVDYIYKPIVPAILRAKVKVFADLHEKSERLARSEAALRRELELSRKAIEGRRESEEKYRTLFSSANDAILVLDAEAEGFVDANRAALRLYGYGRRDFLRLPAGALEPERDGADVAGGCRREGRGRTWIGRQKRADGTTFPAEITHDAVSLRGRRLNLVIVRDITERLQAEEAVRLRERSEVQRQMVATVSHELRTPIAAIKASAETLRQGDVANARTRPRFLKIIETQADRLGALVEELLILGELESGKLKPAPRSIALKPFAEEFVAGISVLAKRKGVTISLDFDDVLSVWADRSHLSGIFQNLIDNAIKYNKKGGSVEVTGGRAGEGEVRVTVRDSGIGIPSEELPLLFQQFQRCPKAKELLIKGNGLGLYIVKTMVEANGGRIWAESVKERGAAFHFTLPADRA